jgi:tRNA uridine 5-carboxymethylaminomethyl modification enzyme
MGRRQYDIIVIGGGHAGAEAAWATVRLGCRVALVSLDPSRIGQMSCNPAIGDALGGLMGLAIDATGIQFRMLNRSKGPAVWGPRAQADKYKYALEVQRLLSSCANLDIVSGEVADIDVVDGRVRAVTLASGDRLECAAAVVTTGTFLRGLMHTGEQQTEGGRVTEAAAKTLSGCLERLGLELGRLKTGTPPRLHKDSIDYSKFEPQPGDGSPAPFSYLNEYEAYGFTPPLPQIHCWLGQTNEPMHEIIRANLHRAPMYSGQIQSTGPRYCPSIEDKVVRFAEKPSHHIFLEPEGLDTDEIYVNGVSTSLPADVQEQVIRLVPGLENARFLRYGYAVEYDMVWPTQIHSTLQTKKIHGLFLAGQINGTSGYEEAAAQGQLAGINAAKHVRGDGEEFVLGRDQAYMGVLVDDLVTKPPTEPYRMFTSRAEHRLHLRNDNADERLTALGRAIGLVDDARWGRFSAMLAMRDTAMELLKRTRLDGTPALDALRRPDVTWQTLAAKIPEAAAIPKDVASRVEIAAKYEGYVQRQDRQVEKFAQLESKLIPGWVDYARVAGLRNEARQKLAKFTPRSLGQALRISGITPADVTVLAIHLDRGRVG